MNSPLISATELKTLMTTNNDLVVIDTRDEAEFKKGHIKGAHNLRDIFTYLADSTPEGVQALREKFAQAFGSIGLSGKETAVIYEESMSTGFGQSCRGYFLLQYLGYENIKILHGGIKAWRDEGFELTQASSTPTSKTFPLSTANSSLIATKDDVLKALGNKEITLLDVRDVDEWIGESSSPYGKDFCPRKGRLPRAKWLEWYRMMKPGKDLSSPVFKTKNEIIAECKTVGINADSEVILYCFKGARASNTYVALKEAGVKNVKIYFGSWNEWSRDPSLPIET